jgi:hypothetical protein
VENSETNDGCLEEKKEGNRIGGSVRDEEITEWVHDLGVKL